MTVSGKVGLVSLSQSRRSLAMSQRIAVPYVGFRDMAQPSLAGAANGYTKIFFKNLSVQDSTHTMSGLSRQKSGPNLVPLGAIFWSIA